jgi:hypothetical protein
MMHAPAHLLIEFVDGELKGRARAEVRRHLSACGSCEAALFELQATRASLASLLTQLDEAEPEAWTPSVQAIYTRSPQPSSRFDLDKVWRWAAGIVLLSGAAAAGAAILRNNAGPAPETQIQRAPPVTPPRAAAGSGVSVSPQRNAAVVELTGAITGTHIVIRITSDSLIGLYSYGETTPAFTAQSGRVVVRMANGPAQLRMLVPASLAELRINANGATLAVFEAGQLHATGHDAGVKVEVEGR